MIRNGLKRAAIAPVVPGYEGMKEREASIVAMGRVLLREAAQHVVSLYEQWGKPEKAAEWKAKLKSLDMPVEPVSKMK